MEAYINTVTIKNVLTYLTFVRSGRKFHEKERCVYVRQHVPLVMGYGSERTST